MAPKEAAKKSAKKVAKKAAKKATGPLKRAQDTRRCYEHFGRVKALLPMVTQDPETVVKTIFLAKEVLQAGNAKEAADALRAAEHLAFGRLALGADEDASLSDGLAEALGEEYRHLLERADERADGEGLSKPVMALFKGMRKEAASAFRAKQYRAACELARGAEALTHVHTELQGRLRAGDIQHLQV